MAAVDPVGVAIFAVTYALVSARRLGVLGLDRPAAALLGAVACVAFGVLTPDAAMAAVESHTLLLLLGVMGMGAFLVEDGFFEVVEAWLAPLLGRPRRLLAAIVWGAGGLSAVLTNDAVCLLGAPLVVRLVRRGGLPAAPFLLALATAANTGSVATLVGNPQNMLCGRLGGLSYPSYLAVAGPLAVVALVANHGVLHLAYRRALAGPVAPLPAVAPRPLTGAHRTTLLALAATAGLYTLGAPLSWTAAGGFMGLLLARRGDVRALWSRIDFPLLVFFGALFVVVEGLRASGATAWGFERFPLFGGDGPVEGVRLAARFLVGSNLVSNVPFILIVEAELAQAPDPKEAWTLLAVVSTFAGNLTLLGSAANVIVAEAGREVGGLGFLEHLRVGAPIAVLTTLLGALWVGGLAM